MKNVLKRKVSVAPYRKEKCAQNLTCTENTLPNKDAVLCVVNFDGEQEPRYCIVFSAMLKTFNKGSNFSPNVVFTREYEFFFFSLEQFSELQYSTCNTRIGSTESCVIKEIANKGK
jgi:hypothetical protein